MNLGNPTEVPVLELAPRVIELTNSRSEIVHRELPEDDPKRRRPDIALAKQKLNWAPTIALEDGLTRTIDDFRSRLDSGVV